MRDIPFKGPRAYKGYAKTEGMAHFGNNSLVLEFQTKDKFLGIIKSGLKTLSIDYGELTRISARRGLSSVKLTLISGSLRTFSSVPGVKGSVLVLKIPRRCRDDIELLASEVNLRITENEIRRLEADEGGDE